MTDNIIKNYRLKQKINQKSIATQLGVSAQRYCTMENTNIIPDKYIDTLANIFHIRPAILRKQLAAKNLYLAPEEITYYREQKGLSTTDLSKKCNVYPALVYNWEHGKFSPSLSNAEFLKTYLEIPDLIIYPDVVLFNENVLILELEDCFLVVSKHPYEYKNMLTSYNKNIFFTYLLNNITINLEAKTSTSSSGKGKPRPYFPKIWSAEPKDGFFMIELEDHVLVISTDMDTFSDSKIDTIKKAFKKESVWGLANSEIPLIYKLQDNYNKARFKADVCKELSKYFTSICDNETDKLICTKKDTKYYCEVSYEKLNNEVIIPKTLQIEFL